MENQETQTSVKLSESLKICKARIEKLVRQNELLIEDIARKDNMLYAEHQEEE
mgnify:CR=1 FL=1|tara:strand:+ start:92 stop:250 length:159 start_codon:yes stop_codon:yes gene_type:complete